MRRKRIASSALILSSFVAFAPAAMGQRPAGGGNGPSNGVAVAPPVSIPRIAVAPQAMPAPARVQPHAIHAPVMNRIPANANVPARPSIHAMRQQAAPNATVGGARTSGAAIGVHRVTPVPVQPHRLNVMSGLAHLPLSAIDFGDSPGLGFDFSHLAAVSDNVGARGRHLIDRVNAGVPLGFSGFLLSPEVIVVEGQQGEAQPAAVEENAEANAEGGAAPERENLQDQFAPASLGPAAPIRDAAEYVFVRRDGTLVFAVGYSWDHGTLHYITREGYRRSIAGDALDMDATQQFNEQRGLNFCMPA